MLVPVFLVMTLTMFWPILTTAFYSFHENAGAGAVVGQFVGFDNYVSLLTGELDILLSDPFINSNPYGNAVMVTLIFTVSTVVLEGLFGVIQALLLDRQFRGRSIVRVAILLPWAVPIAIQGMIFYIMFAPGIGAGIEAFKSVGLIVSDTPTAASADVIHILIVADIWKRSAFVALIVLAGLQSIDRTLYEVGRVAGASKWKRFKTITFPLVLPALLVALLFRTIGAMKVYGLIEVLGSCSTIPSISCLTVGEFQTGSHAFASTIATVAAAITLILALFYLVQYQERSL